MASVFVCKIFLVMTVVMVLNLKYKYIILIFYVEVKMYNTPNSNLLCGGKNILHTIYVIQIILRPLSALFGLQFMLPMEKSVTFTGTCANEIIPNG